MDKILWLGKPTVLSFSSLYDGIALAIIASLTLGLVIRTTFFWAPILGLATAILIIGATVKRANSTTYMVSNYGIYKEQHHLTRIDELPFNKIADITLTCGFFGKIFHFGTVTVKSASISFHSLVLTGVSKPEELRRLIIAAKEKAL